MTRGIKLYTRSYYCEPPNDPLGGSDSFGVFCWIKLCVIFSQNTISELYQLWKWQNAKEKETLLTRHSSQHCPCAHTASPLRVHVVALQHGFMHSWHKGKRKHKIVTNMWTWSSLWSFSPGWFPVRSKPPGQRIALPVRGFAAYSSLTRRPLSNDFCTKTHMFGVWEFWRPLHSKRSVF